MTDRERLDLLWTNHTSHIDEHRLLSKRIDEVVNHIKQYHELMLGMCPFDIKEGNYKELCARLDKLEFRQEDARDLQRMDDYGKEIYNLNKKIDDLIWGKEALETEEEERLAILVSAITGRLQALEMKDLNLSKSTHLESKDEGHQYCLTEPMKEGLNFCQAIEWLRRGHQIMRFQGIGGGSITIQPEWIFKGSPVSREDLINNDWRVID